MPDPAGGVYEVSHLHGAVKVGRWTFELPTGKDGRVATVGELIEFLEGEVRVITPSSSDWTRIALKGRS